MTVTGIENGYQKRSRIYIDEEYRFSLYDSEIRRYQLKPGMELDEDVYRQITEAVLKRGKQKALNLLKRMDYTEGELRERLKKSEFLPEVIEQIIAYIHSYHYLDDTRYTENYINYKKSSKSRQQIRMELVRKGVDAELIEQKLAEGGGSDDEAIKKAIARKTKAPETLSYEEKQKIAAYLFRKGFQKSDIRQQLLL